jgi:hypothetical protein
MGRDSSGSSRFDVISARFCYEVHSTAPHEVEAVKTLLSKHEVVMEIKQARSILDSSLKAHLANKGKLCLHCELPNDLCKCVKRAQEIRKIFEPVALRGIE